MRMPDPVTENEGESLAVPAPTRAGFIGMAGAPNTGKSTLLNRILGQKLAIVTPCPQTTRHRLGGIWTEGSTQAILVDVPGILETGEKLNRALVDCAREGLKGCDLVLHVRTARSVGSPDELRSIEVLRELRLPVWEVWNKIDIAPPVPTAATPLKYDRGFAVSAKTGRGIEKLREALREALPEGPWLFPADDLSDQDLRFLAAERVREKLFLNLRQEIPYGIATWTETWQDRPDGRTYVRVVIQVEREAHKRIVIGEGGGMLRRVGSAARREIEELTGNPIYLELWVRCKPHWREDDEELRRLGLIHRDRG
jgi:GTPase